MTTRRPSGARAGAMRFWVSSLPASASATGSATCAMGNPPSWIIGAGPLGPNPGVKRRWEIPQGLHMRPRGSWRVGEYHVIHPPSLRYFKSHLINENGAAAVVDGEQRIPITVEGPAFQVITLVIDRARGEARAVLDDGSGETLGDGALGMNRSTGRFERTVRAGTFRAI